MDPHERDGWITTLLILALVALAFLAVPTHVARGADGPPSPVERNLNAVPPPGVTFAAARERSIIEGKPLVVWVGQPSRDVAGCVCCRCDDLVFVIAGEEFIGEDAEGQTIVTKTPEYTARPPFTVGVVIGLPRTAYQECGWFIEVKERYVEKVAACEGVFTPDWIGRRVRWARQLPVLACDHHPGKF
jgi:hypothetical protein